MILIFLEKFNQILFFSDMAPFYEEVAQELVWKKDDALLSSMKAANTEKLKQLDEAIEDAEKNLGETEIRDSMLAKAEYLCKIGDKVCCFKTFIFMIFNFQWQQYSYKRNSLAKKNLKMFLGLVVKMLSIWKKL